jgi:multiple antibiotic resistance protein
LIDLFVSSFITFFVVIDPIGVATIFLGMVGRQGVQNPLSLATRASVIGFGLMLIFALVGKGFIESIGISLPAFRIAGGLLLFYLSFRMVLGYHENDMAEASAASKKDRRDIAVFPLAIPLIAGPGGLTVSILMMDRANGDLMSQITVLMALLVVGVMSWFALLSANRMQKFLGQSGVDIVARVLGVLLAALSVQFVADGVRALTAA